MKKGAAFVFPLLVVFLHLFASCSYAPSDPTPYIPQEYRDAFLCSGSFTLEETKEAAPEEGRSSPSLPQVLSASYRVRQGNAFYDMRYREGESLSAEPVSVGLSSPVTAPSELSLEGIPSLLKTIWEFSKVSEGREKIFVSFSSAGELFDHLPNQGLPCYVYSLSEETLFALSGSYEGNRSMGTCTISSEDSGTLFYILIDL